MPGALPPVIGWVAARGTINIEAWTLFAILFLWQLPHSLSIACIYRDEYAQAGFRLLPVIHPDGKSTRRQIVSNCLALLVVALLPHINRHCGHPLLLRRANFKRHFSGIRHQVVNFSYNRIRQTSTLRFTDISTVGISYDDT